MMYLGVFQVCRIRFQNTSDSARNWSPACVLYYIFSTMEKSSLDSDSTCHKLAKKGSSKQAGLQAQIPLL